MSPAKEPVPLRFSSQHVWVRCESSGDVTVGLSNEAVVALSDLVFIELLEPGSHVTRGALLGEVESTIATALVLAPCTGSVIAVNEAVLTHPFIVNTDPLGDGWLAIIKPSNRDELSDLLEESQYAALWVRGSS